MIKVPMDLSEETFIIFDISDINGDSSGALNCGKLDLQITNVSLTIALVLDTYDFVQSLKT